MSEENFSIRLQKAMKEFNVGLSTIVEFLGKKGFKIDSSPNTKLNHDMYALLVKEYQGEKEVKKNADQLGNLTYKGTVVTMENSKPSSKKSDDDYFGEDEVTIRTNVVTESPRKEEKKKERKVEAPKVEKPKVENVAAKSEKVAEEAKIQVEEKVEKPIVKEEIKVENLEAKAEETPIEQPTVKEEKPVEEKIVKVEEKPFVEEKKEEKEEKEEKVEEAKPTVVEEKSVENIAEKAEAIGIHVVGKIELPEKQRHKDKRNKKEDKDKKEEGKAPKSSEQKQKPQNKKAQEQGQRNKPQGQQANSHNVNSQKQATQTVTPETKATPEIIETKPEEPKKPVNFIPIQTKKLEGPKIIDKIELPLERKPKGKVLVATSGDESALQDKKKKRKRIGKEAVNTEEFVAGKQEGKPRGNKNVANGKPGGKQQGDAKQQGDTKQPGDAKQQQGGKQQPTKSGDEKRQKNNKFNKKAKRPVIEEKQELSDEEIQKQIKDTLARLSPLGKSKTSKHRREKRQRVGEELEEEMMMQQEEKKILKVTEFVTANELATMMNIPVTKVISTCMSLGVFVSINQRLNAEILSLVAEEFGFKVEFISIDVQEALKESDEPDQPEDLMSRAPIVTVMGHVDHGKTKLLDFIRHSNVAAGEAGGITQHVGAYEVSTESGKTITFLDTPGHEAFTAMRARGASVTDVAIIVIAADDSVMPQTVEAINHAQAANVPIVFAINKIDKPTANPQKIYEQLANMNILVEEWGGKYQSQEISAKQGINVDKLLEKVLLEAEMLDLKANPHRLAKGTIIESALDKGRGYVAKILVQDGTLRQGDMVLAGTTYGKVKAMFNERNQTISEAGPSTPLLLLGLNGAPQAGDSFTVMTDEREVKAIVTRRQQLQREQGLRTQKHITLDEIGRRIAIGDFKELNIIVKADVDGSVEALSDSLLKLSTEEVQVNVIHKAVGAISESDITLASASNAVIVGFNVRPTMNARKVAEREQIDIRLYSIIYTAIEEIKAAIEGMLAPEIEEVVTCNIEIREVFNISKVGRVAGCLVLDGKVNRQTKIRIIRDGIVVHTGTLGSLKRFKDDVKEVSAGFECGLNIQDYNDIKVGDIIEGYMEKEISRKL